MAYAGFDRDEFPGLDTMKSLKQLTNLVWCGYYLKAPSQSGRTWRGQRAALVAMGWGTAPIFVGQQSQGPGSNILTDHQGRIDGRLAVFDMKEEGYPAGSFVFLDLENGPPFGQAQRDYVAAWIDTVDGNGYRAGVYGSYLLAGDIKALRPKIRLWAFHVSTTKEHPVDGIVFPTPDPGAGASGAVMWQRDMAVRLVAFGNLLVDLDVSNLRDPSAPELVASARTASAPAPTVAAAPPPPDAPVSPPAPQAISVWTAFWRNVGEFFGARRA